MKLCFLLLLVAIATAAAVPQRRFQHQHLYRPARQTSEDKCASRCTGVKNKFHYRVGQSYNYRFDSTSNLNFLGSRQPSNPLRQTATATISVIEPCEFSLKLSNVQIQGHEDGNWRTELERRPLRFSFDDGIIREICPAPEEPVWALNIKRAVLSTFQNALEGSAPRKEVYETDVSGKCPTRYELSERRGEKTILRKKDLVSCSDHHGNYTSIRGVKYNIKSKLQNAPLMDSSQDCKHVINRDSILKEASCTEKHSFRPFRGKEGGGIVSDVIQKIEFVDERQGVDQSVVGPRQSLRFDHSEFNERDSAESKAAVLSNIRELCQVSSSDVRPETPGLFTELVYRIRKLSFEDLQAVYQDVKKNSLCPMDKKFFLDALPVCGTENCVKLMVSILKTERLEAVDVFGYATAFSFVPRPTLQMIREISPLVATIQPSGLLGISSLVHGYCRENVACAEIPDVSNLIKKLTEKLGDKCSSVRTDKTKGVFILKAIGNIGHSQSPVPTLLSCFREKRNPTEVRAEAIKALRRTPCGQQKEALMELFRDTTEDIEIRIDAFVALMKCVSPQILTQVNEVLDKETVTQVGSFVYSYLKAKSRTSDPCQQELTHLLRRHRFNSKFNRDPRKFSRFYEIGNFMQQTNMGGHVEGAWIMEPEGYLPRQGFFNLTVHLFGSSINLFEIGGRMEGLERLNHKLFGPEGYFTNPSGYYFNQQSQKEHSNSRVKTIHDLFTQKRKFQEYLSLSMYFKVFGDDLAFYDFRNENMVEEIKNYLDTEKLMEKLAKQQNMKVSKNILFLDSTLTIPTISGLPLRLGVNGTASVNVEYGGKMDFRKLLKAPHNGMDILGEIKPSAAIELSSSLAIHVRDMKTGVRMVGRIHTSTAAKGVMQLRDGEFKTKIELPDDKMEIIDVQTQLFHIVGDRHIEEPGVVTKKYSARQCTCPTFSRYFGIKVCGDISFPQSSMTPKAPYFPLTGPMRTTVTVEKDDATMQGYELTTKYVNNPNNHDFEFGVDTPGSTVDRKVLAKILYKPGEMVQASLRTPVKQFSLDGTLTRTQDLQDGQLSLIIDNKERYAVSAKLQKTIQRGATLQNLEAEITVPNKEAMKLTGNLEKQSRRYALNFNLEGLYDQPVEGKAKWEQPETSYNKFNAELMFKCPVVHFDFNANGEIEQTGNMQYKYNIEYFRPRIDKTPHKISATHKQVLQRTGDMLKFSSTSTVDSSWYPNSNSVTKYQMIKSSDRFENRLNIKYGAQQKTADFVQVTMISNGDIYTTDLKVDIPEAKLTQEAKITYQNRYPNSFMGKLEWPTFKDFTGELKLTNSKAPLWTLEAEAKAEYTGREIRAYKKIEEVAPQDFHSTAIIQWQKNKQIEVETDIKLKSQRGTYEYELTAEAKMSGEPDTIKFEKRFKMGRDETKYVAMASKGSRSLYDFKLDTIKEPQTSKTRFQTSLKSQYMDDLDYAISGHVDKHPRTTMIYALVKKDRRDWMKGELVIPSQIRNNPDLRVKGHVFWDMHTGNIKEVMGEYKLKKHGENRGEHEWQMKLKSDPTNYLWVGKIVRGEYYTVNSTLSKNNQPMIETNMGGKMEGNLAMDPRDLALDFKLRTYAPLQVRHLQGLLTHRHGPREFQTTGYIQCLVSNKKASFESSGKSETVNRRGTKFNGKFNIKINDKEFNWEEEITIPNTQQWWEMSGKTKERLTWAPGKTITMDSEYQNGQFTSMKFNLKTPFAKLSEMKGEWKLENARITPKLTSEVEWNKNKKISLVLNNVVNDPKAFDLTMNLGTSFEALKKLEARLKYSYVSDWDIETWLKWNEAGLLKFVYTKASQYGKETARLGAWCKIPNSIDWVANADFEYMAAQQKYGANCELKLGQDNYKLTTDVSTQTKTGEIKLETPYENLNSASLKVSANGQNEYKIETEKNGEQVGTIIAMLKMNTGDHEIKFEVDKVKYPFNLIYEGKYTDQLWKIKAELSTEPNKPAKKTYGIQLSDEEIAPSKSESQLTLRHPRREMLLKLVRDGSEANKYKLEAEIQPNMASNRAPTKLHFVSETIDATIKQQLIVNDPSIPNGMKLTSLFSKEGSCSDYSAACKVRGQFKFDYSGGDPKKMLTVKSLYEIEPAEQRGKFWRPSKIDTYFEINHEATDLHAKIYFKSPDERKWEGGVQFKNRQRQIRSYAASLEYPKEMDSMTLTLINPTDTWAIRYKALTAQSCQIMVLRNGEPAYDIIDTYNPDEKLARMEIRKSATSEVLFHISAQLANSDVARVRMWHTENGRRIDDAEFTIKLNRADLISTNFYVRPGFNREIQHVARKKVDEWKASQSKTNALAEVGSDAYYSVSSTGERLRTDIRAQVDPFFQYLSDEKTRLVDEMGPALEEITEQIQRYWDMAKELIWAFLDVAEMTMDQVMETVPSDYFKDSYYQAKQSIASIPQTMREMAQPITEAWEALSEILSDISDKVSSAKDKIVEKLNLRDMKRKLRETWRDIKNSELMQRLEEWYEKAVSTLTGLSPKELYDKYYPKVENRFNRMKQQTSDMWDDWKSWLLEYQGGKYLAEWAQEIGTKLRDTYTYVDAEDKVDNAIAWLRDFISSYNPTTEAGWNRFMPRVKVNDPETGRYEMEIPLPMKVHSLEHLVSHAHPANLRALRNRIQNQISAWSSKESESQKPEKASDGSSTYSVWDTVYQYKPVSWKPVSWVPPYHTTAYLIGGHHFVTFDGHVYDFMANCEFLLARDFQDKKFTISAAFKQKGNSAELDSLNVHTNGHLIEIPRTGRVKVDGQATELPWQKMDTMDGQVLVQVKRKNDYVSLKTQDRLKIKCYNHFHVCVIRLPGWYHGKSAGLLGSNDNEPSNDWMTPSGVRARTAGEFASSWHLGGGSCNPNRNLAPTAKVQANSAEYRTCRRYFKDNSSPFRSCFSQVMPGPYMAMCSVDMQAYGQKGYCTIAAAFVKACRHQGVNLDMLSQCVSCQIPQMPALQEGQDTRVEGSAVPKAADVVFVPEELPCMKWSQTKIPELARQIQGSLGKKRLSNIRYGVVGFNGEGVHYKPHFHTGAGMLNFDLNGLQEAVRKLVFEKITLTSQTPIDPMLAMDWLIDNYPFRPAVEKIVILLTCTECTGEKVGYYDLQNRLLETGITFHMIKEEEVEVDGSEGEFLGLDASTLFTTSGDNSDLRGDLVAPHDSCTILAQETNGTVFSSTMPHGQMIQRLAQEVGKKVVPKTCQLCECQLEKLTPITMCYPCDIPRPVSLTNGDKFFNIPYLKLGKSKKVVQDSAAAWLF